MPLGDNQEKPPPLGRGKQVVLATRYKLFIHSLQACLEVFLLTFGIHSANQRKACVGNTHSQGGRCALLIGNDR